MDMEEANKQKDKKKKKKKKKNYCTADRQKWGPKQIFITEIRVPNEDFCRLKCHVILKLLFNNHNLKFNKIF